ncbi:MULTISPECIES: ImuA family protein [Thalassospira]|uniref:Protein ImuA n=2 Tax=Thalassospira TaxID=168934 RepID=A0A367W9S3_9PROT|nr:MULTISPECIES: protein ImuA [Thalassospira]MDG4719744.1 protein ImuA [Thalassospira sp. FZY0004]RCK38196.1 protein ImuA [Thalassospira profundimaris]
MLSERLHDARVALVQAEKQWKANIACLSMGAGDVISTAFGNMELSGNISLGGFSSIGLHEVICLHDAGAASILVWYLAQLDTAKPEANPMGRSIFWVRQRRAIDQGGFYHLALPIDRETGSQSLMMVVDQQATALWACEEVAKSGQVASVILETTDYDLTAARRLQLACEAAGTRMIVMRRASRNGRLMPSSALTRWKIEPVSSSQQNMTGNIHQLSLIGGRGVRPGSWKVKADAATFSLSVVDPLENRLPYHPSGPASEGRHVQV